MRSVHRRRRSIFLSQRGTARGCVYSGICLSLSLSLSLSCARALLFFLPRAKHPYPATLSYFRRDDPARGPGIYAPVCATGRRRRRRKKVGGKQQDKGPGIAGRRRIMEQLFSFQIASERSFFSTPSTGALEIEFFTGRGCVRG